MPDEAPSRPPEDPQPAATPRADGRAREAPRGQRAPLPVDTPHELPAAIQALAALPRARVGVLSDTHVGEKTRNLPVRMLRAFEGADLILHGGDIVVPDVLEWLGRIAPVVAVGGNNDPPELCEALGFRRLLEVAGARIGLVHGHRGRGRNTPDRAVQTFRRESGLTAVVFGHSHMPVQQAPGSRLFIEDAPLSFHLFNPGSPTDRRHAPRCSYGQLHIESGVVRTELIWL